MIELLYTYWRESLFALLSALVSWMGKNLISYKKDLDHTKHGVKALLRDRIIGNYNSYMEKGCMPIYASENIEQMYQEYKALGGNGLVDGLMNRIRQLPIENNCAL